MYQDQFRYSCMLFAYQSTCFAFSVCVCVLGVLFVCLSTSVCHSIGNDSSLLGFMDLVLRRSNESRWALSLYVSMHRLTVLETGSFMLL